MGLININADLVNGIGTILDDLRTTDEEREAAKIKLTELYQNIALAQIEVNKVEAASASLFVAGWRPGVGWVCVAGLALATVVLPTVTFAAWLISALLSGTFEATSAPIPSMTELFNLLVALLGLGAMRTFEKTQGVAEPAPAIRRAVTTKKGK